MHAMKHGAKTWSEVRKNKRMQKGKNISKKHKAKAQSNKSIGK